MLEKGWLNRQFANVEREVAQWPPSFKRAAGFQLKPWYCDYCDGCGWYEGGKTIKTTCHVCKGKGIIYK